MKNLARQFADLLPKQPLLVGTVTAHNADGTSTVTLPAGGTLRVQGQSVAVNSSAFVQGGRIQGEAPSLTLYEIAI